METKTLTVVNEVQVPVKETWRKKFWQKLDGNKTMILSMAFAIVQAVPIPEPWKGLILTVLGAAGGKTLYDHAKNGGFKRSVKGVNLEGNVSVEKLCDEMNK